MFVVVAVFLTGMLFVVQQMLLGYSAIDLASPFQSRDDYVIRNFIDAINQTIITQRDTGDANADCLDFERNLIALLTSMKRELSRKNYLMETLHVIDCGNWDNEYPAEAPLNLTVISTAYYASGGSMSFYHGE